MLGILHIAVAGQHGALVVALPLLHLTLMGGEGEEEAVWGLLVLLLLLLCLGGVGHGVGPLG